MIRLVAWLTVNDVATGSSVAYPEMQPLDLELSPRKAFDLALAAAGRMRGWRIVMEDLKRRRFRAEAATRWLRFVDDVQVEVEARAGGGARIQVRSRSRVGRGDFGANARRIRAYLRLVGESAASHSSASALSR